MFNYHNHLSSPAQPQLVYGFLDWQDACVTFSILASTCSCPVCYPEPDKEVASGIPSLQEQAVPFMALFRAQASLSARPGRGFPKHFTVKRPAEDQEPLLFHSSELYIFFFLCLPDLLTFCQSFRLIPPVFS